MSEPSLFTPVHLLTGFLGSGKTTLLRRLLMDPALADTAVLINEFGEIGLDHHLVERIDETMVLLQSGCVCCSIRGELAEALRDLLSKRERGVVPLFSRVVIETTGLSDPFPVLSTIRSDAVLRHHFRIGGVITTVDAINGANQLETYTESNRQVAVADHIVLTKTDLRGAKTDPVLLEKIGRLNPDASYHVATAEAPDAVVLLGVPTTAHSAGLSAASGFYCDSPVTLLQADGTRHDAAFSSLVVTVDKPIDWTSFGIWLTMLLNRHGPRVLRVKGILNIEGEDRPVAVHGVQHLVHSPVHMEAWPSDDRHSRIVFIVDGLDPNLLKRSFEVFVSVPGTKEQQPPEPAARAQNG